MSFIERTGDIFTTEAEAIGHGVNTRGLMGAGIAKQFRDKFPSMYGGYKLACERDALQAGSVLPWPSQVSPFKVVYNIASQDEPGPHARLEWLVSGLVKTLQHAEREGIDTLALPQIGCGIGGLQWSTVREVLQGFANVTPVNIEAWTYA